MVSTLLSGVTTLQSILAMVLFVSGQQQTTSVVVAGKMCAMMVTRLAFGFPKLLEIIINSSIAIQFEHFWVLLLSNAKIQTKCIFHCSVSYSRKCYGT